MFAGFVDRDFDAYAPQKWRSNAFNRERLEVKQKLLDLGRELGGGLVAGDGSPLACEPSIEHPTLWNHKQVEAQHLYFWRNDEARKELDKIIDRQKTMAALVDDPSPQRNHIFLGVSITYAQIEVALRLHPDARVDRQNLERKLQEPWERSKLVDLIRALGPAHAVGVGGASARAASEIDDPALGELSAEFARGAPTGWLALGRSLTRADVTALGAGLTAEVRAALEALLPVFHFIAWTRDNDFVSMREVLKQERQVKRQKGLARNDRVRIVRGMLAGKSGVVQDVDPKGALKILVGKMAVKVDAADVIKQD